MRAHQVLLLVLVAVVATDAISLGLPSLFSSLVSPAKDAEIEEEIKEPADTTEEESIKEEDEDDLLEYNDPKKPHKKPTKKPLFGIIPHLSDHPLHPHNNPHHPLHPDNLHLPHLPALPHLPLPHLPALGHKEPIHATKTVYVEVTDRVTIHPVCMTVVHNLKPPCLPYVPEHHHHGHPHHPHHHGHLHHPHHPHHHLGHPLHHRDDEAKADEPLPIQPTAAVTLTEPTRILGGVSMSEGEQPDSAEASELYGDEDLGAESVRSARYVELTPSISAPETVKIKEEPEEVDNPEESERSPLDMVQKLFHHKPETHYKTKTLWVTKVEKILDTRVTATLIAKNCIPSNSHIPWCSKHHGGVYGPGFHGHHSEHIYHEGPHGHHHSNIYTEKEEDLASSNDVQEVNDYEKSVDEESRTEGMDFPDAGPEQRESGSGDTPVTE